MNVTIFGATGSTGRELVKQALATGYNVTALVRNPLELIHPCLTMIQGDLFDMETVKNIVKNSDSVISVVGFTPKIFAEKSTDIYSKSASIFVEAMTAVNKKKLIFCSSAGVENDPHELWVYKHIVKPFFLKKSYKDMQLAEKIIINSNLDWIIVRPSRLTNGAPTTTFRVSKRFRAKGGSYISRADLAFFILNQVTGTEWIHQTPTLTN